ncbi:hypothetical protein P0092_09465 [Ruminiclostridium papyrosolvens DSM 2782]|uniref:hypothetical protein n=1 Tax=Ruminiclostridium papyrosolvens TaxID=29362 RepID=UPI000310377E|nr:hypothetical protein [Ruminiclostridium papyrosolvens]WES36075.1 hypothetical protein P0092_08965 [Ruminiclostridium papyrosolvens DSM 2782]WES36173.1 hypothetical protein P0092_09465 [Ruminiclostridium papyrosolvens DSM 2782]
MQTIIIVFLCVVILVQNITHRIERKDLYNRIMANDLTEYNQKPIKHKSVKCAIRKNHDGRRE